MKPVPNNPIHATIIFPMFQWHGPNDTTGPLHGCYDEVDMSLCFEDSAIFYDIGPEKID